MKYFFPFLLISCYSGYTQAQQTVETGSLFATEKRTINFNGAGSVKIISSSGSVPGAEAPILPDMFREIETQLAFFVKGSKVKVVKSNDYLVNSTIRDFEKQTIANLREQNGEKKAYVGSFQDDVKSRQTQKKQLDSLMQSLRINPTAAQVKQASEADSLFPVKIIETGKTKSLLGYTAKQAFIETTSKKGVVDTAEVWYTSDLVWPQLTQALVSSSGTASKAVLMPGIQKINGVVLQYKNTDNVGGYEFTVTKINTAKPIADKEFEIPKDFEVVPLSEQKFPDLNYCCPR